MIAGRQSRICGSPQLQLFFVVTVRLLDLAVDVPVVGQCRNCGDSAVAVLGRSWCASATDQGVFVEVIQLVVELIVWCQCHRSRGLRGGDSARRGSDRGAPVPKIKGSSWR